MASDGQRPFRRLRHDRDGRARVHQPSPPLRRSHREEHVRRGQGELVARAGRVAADDARGLGPSSGARARTRTHRGRRRTMSATRVLVSVATMASAFGEHAPDDGLFDGAPRPGPRARRSSRPKLRSVERSKCLASRDLSHLAMRTPPRTRSASSIVAAGVIVGGEATRASRWNARSKIARFSNSSPLGTRKSRTFGETVEAATFARSVFFFFFQRDLVAHCASMLAPFKVPRRIVILADMPTTATGRFEDTRSEPSSEEESTSGEASTPSNLRPNANAIPGSRRSTVPPSSRSFAPSSRVSFPALATIDDDAPLAHAGLHSVAAVELSRRLNVALADATSETLPSLLVFDRPTVRAIADYVARDERGVLNLDGSHRRRVAPFAASSSFSAAASLRSIRGASAGSRSEDRPTISSSPSRHRPRRRGTGGTSRRRVDFSSRAIAIVPDPSEMASIVTRRVVPRGGRVRVRSRNRRRGCRGTRRDGPVAQTRRSPRRRRVRGRTRRETRREPRRETRRRVHVSCTCRVHRGAASTRITSRRTRASRTRRPPPRCTSRV